jgi:hypothetical protein
MSNILLRRALPCIAIGLLLVATTACDMMNSIKPSQAHALDLTLYDFAGAVRWGDFDKAYDFVDPKTKIEHPLTDLERARFKQVDIASYDVISRLDGLDTVDQQIQLGVVNRNTQVGRTVVYHEHWRWDATIKRWWLTTGLPDISPQ